MFSGIGQFTSENFNSKRGVYYLKKYFNRRNEKFHKRFNDGFSDLKLE